MMGTRSISVFDMNFQIYRVDEQDNILENIAAANDFSVADAAFREAPKRYSNARIQMRNGARIVRTIKPDGTVIN